MSVHSGPCVPSRTTRQASCHACFYFELSSLVCRRPDGQLTQTRYRAARCSASCPGPQCCGGSLLLQAVSVRLSTPLPTVLWLRLSPTLLPTLLWVWIPTTLLWLWIPSTLLSSVVVTRRHGLLTSPPASSPWMSSTPAAFSSSTSVALHVYCLEHFTS